MAAAAAISLPLQPGLVPRVARPTRSNCSASAAIAATSSSAAAVPLTVPPRAAGGARGETTMRARAGQRRARSRAAVRATVGDAEKRGEGEAGAGEGREQQREEAWQVAARMYGAVNARDVAGAVACVGERCEYHDMIYRDAMRGRQAIAQHLSRVLQAMPPGVAFVIDDVSKGDEHACGVMWHAELDGRPLPLSRGCSFIRCQREDGALLITFVRDIPEPTMKPGSAAL
ncbi:hypothetical protein CLOP_g12150, partial [Closterium sp. NIES-67]